MTEENRLENVRLEFEKADAAQRAARALGDLGLRDDAISRAYYAAFHAVVAALFFAGLQAKTHSGAHDLLYQHFIKPGHLPKHVSKDLSALHGYREQADYSTTIRFEAETAEEELERAERVVRAVRGFLSRSGVVFSSPATRQQ